MRLTPEGCVCCCPSAQPRPPSCRRARAWCADARQDDRGGLPAAAAQLHHPRCCRSPSSLCLCWPKASCPPHACPDLCLQTWQRAIWQNQAVAAPGAATWKEARVRDARALRRDLLCPLRTPLGSRAQGDKQCMAADRARRCGHLGSIAPAPWSLSAPGQTPAGAPAREACIRGGEALTGAQRCTTPSQASAAGAAALEAINDELGLAFDAWDVQYYTRLFGEQLRRDPTNVELFDIAQSNSEHRRARPPNPTQPTKTPNSTPESTPAVSAMADSVRWYSIMSLGASRLVYSSPQLARVYAAHSAPEAWLQCHRLAHAQPHLVWKSCSAHRPSRVRSLHGECAWSGPNAQADTLDGAGPELLLGLACSRHWFFQALGWCWTASPHAAAHCSSWSRRPWWPTPRNSVIGFHDNSSAIRCGRVASRLVLLATAAALSRAAMRNRFAMLFKKGPASAHAGFRVMNIQSCLVAAGACQQSVSMSQLTGYAGASLRHAPLPSTLLESCRQQHCGGCRQPSCGCCAQPSIGKAGHASWPASVCGRLGWKSKQTACGVCAGLPVQGPARAGRCCRWQSAVATWAPWDRSRWTYDVLLTAETHNFPCAVAPYPGTPRRRPPPRPAASARHRGWAGHRGLEICTRRGQGRLALGQTPRAGALLRSTPGLGLRSGLQPAPAPCSMQLTAPWCVCQAPAASREVLVQAAGLSACPAPAWARPRRSDRSRLRRRGDGGGRPHQGHPRDGHRQHHGLRHRRLLRGQSARGGARAGRRAGSFLLGVPGQPGAAPAGQAPPARWSAVHAARALRAQSCLVGACLGHALDRQHASSALSPAVWPLKLRPCLLTPHRLFTISCAARGTRRLSAPCARMHCWTALSRRAPGQPISFRQAAPGVHHHLWHTQPCLQILTDASNGASDYGNKFGEPLVAGFTRSFGLRLPGGQRREWLKPIMFRFAPPRPGAQACWASMSPHLSTAQRRVAASQCAGGLPAAASRMCRGRGATEGLQTPRHAPKPDQLNARSALAACSGGLGNIDHRHLDKAPPQHGWLVVKIGGPAYRIGLGGGAASSVASGSNKADPGLRRGAGKQVKLCQVVAKEEQLPARVRGGLFHAHTRDTPLCLHVACTALSACTS